MALTAHYLADKSALARTHISSVSTVIDNLVEVGLLATCGVVGLEVLYSARNGAEYRKMRGQLRSYHWLPTNDGDFWRAIDVQGQLAASGRHRAVSLADLLIAAVAERHRVSVLHYDADFDMIAEVTGQPTQWIVPCGSI